MQALRLLAFAFALGSVAHAQETVTFLYDHVGHRIEKSSQGMRTSIFMDEAFEIVGASSTKYIRGSGGIVASITTGGSGSGPVPAVTSALSGSTREGVPPGVRYVHSDHLESTSVVTDATGVEVSRYLYSPYGEVIRSNSTGQDTSRYKFTGQEEDVETALQYYTARYRDPVTTLWLSADTMVPSQDILGHNRFAYVRDNPLRYTDPTGHEPDEAPALHVLDFDWETGSTAVTHREGEPRKFHQFDAATSTIRTQAIDRVGVFNIMAIDANEPALAGMRRAYQNAVLYTNAEDLVNKVAAAIGDGALLTLTLMTHGNEEGIVLGPINIHSRSVEAFRILAGLRDRFARGGAVNLHACSVGLATDFLRAASRTFDVPVRGNTEPIQTVEFVARSGGKVIQHDITSMTNGMFIECTPGGVCSGSRIAPAGWPNGVRSIR